MHFKVTVTTGLKKDIQKLMNIKGKGSKFFNSIVIHISELHKLNKLDPNTYKVDKVPGLFNRSKRLAQLKEMYPTCDVNDLREMGFSV